VSADGVPGGIEGNAWAWGLNGGGEVGDGTVTSQPFSVFVHTPVGVRFVDASAGNGFAVAVDDAGHLWAWGQRLGAVGAALTPRPVAGPAGVSFVQVSPGDDFAVALDSNGISWEWGRDDVGSVFGQAGCGPCSTVPVRTRTPADTPTFRSVSAGPYGLVAALASDGRAWTWRSNSSGQLGYGGTQASSSIPRPVRMPSGVEFTAVSAGGIGGGYGGAHVAALDSSGGGCVWGAAAAGEVGDSTERSAVRVPTAAHAPAGVVFTSVLAASGNRVPRRADTGAERFSAIGWGATFCIALGTGGRTWWLGGMMDPTAQAPLPVTPWTSAA